MEKQKRIDAFAELGRRMKSLTVSQDFERISRLAYQNNTWFSEVEVKKAFLALSEMLDKNAIESWCDQYHHEESSRESRVGVVMAGNIPMVGFHDALSVLISGRKLLAKLSSNDKILMPLVFDMLTEIEPAFKDRIEVTEKLQNMDAVIATGSDNSARYFNYYFKDIPSIIRKNRNAVAILTGEESDEELAALGEDIFTYYGMGCRNVSKLYLPRDYNLDKIFIALTDFGYLMSQNKYMSNYDYYSAVLLLKKIPFLTNNFLILKEDAEIACPVSILNFEYYDSIEKLKDTLKINEDKIQCKVSVSSSVKDAIPPGCAQKPRLWDYADGVDTMEFLKEN